MNKIGNQWDEILNEEFNKDYFKELENFVNKEYEEYEIFPQKDEIFNALKLTPPDKVKVVILGQDPYINKGQAHGLAFSVKEEWAQFPPSLKNIYREISSDLNIPIEDINKCNRNLTDWAEQGVLLLNTSLTVRAGKSNSHYGRGWEVFTNAIIEHLGQNCEHIVFMLWGNNAINKKRFINQEKNLVLTSVHPSPLSVHRGFFGCKHFSKTNAYLKDNGLEEIKWITTL